LHVPSARAIDVNRLQQLQLTQNPRTALVNIS